jgi:hypothetical protein
MQQTEKHKPAYTSCKPHLKRMSGPSIASMILLLLARSRLLPTLCPVLMKASLLRSNAAGSQLQQQTEQKDNSRQAVHAMHVQTLQSQCALAAEANRQHMRLIFAQHLDHS